MNSINTNNPTVSTETPNINPATTKQSVFWMNDVAVLFRNNGYMMFVPTNNMTRIEQLNALTLFFVYMILLLLIIDKSNEYLYIPIVGIIIIIVYYNIFIGDEKPVVIVKNETMNNIRSDNYDNYSDNSNDSNNSQHRSYTTQSDCSNGYEFNGFNEFDEFDKLESSQNEANRKYPKDKLFMNTLLNPLPLDSPFAANDNDSMEENVPVACNSDDEDINQNMKLEFNGDMYRDIEDVFDKKNAERQFSTVAHTIPNDMEAFANWCYKFPPTGKTNQERCLRYEDLRMKYNHGNTL